MKENLLIIFAKNPEKGKVKTRLAKDIGEDKALVVYQKLLWHTLQVTEQVQNADKAVYYTNQEDKNEVWPKHQFHGFSQKGQGLGERMHNAFKAAFEIGYKKVVLIGSDCPELKPEHLQNAFGSLQQHTVVIGPAIDGGYYLIGSSEMLPELFHNKTWSSDKVLQETLETLQHLNKTPSLLPPLSDIDTAEDLARFPHFAP